MDRGRAIEMVRHRRDGGLPLQRARSRVSSFVYGNITVLGALVAVTPGLVRDWSAVVIVAATAAATFIAHVSADLVADRVGPEDEQRDTAPWSTVRAEVQDALPIVSAGSAPVVLFALAALGVVPPGLAQAAAAALVVARLALTGVAVERVSGREPSALAWWSGFGLAIVAAVVGVIKGFAH